MRRIAGLVLLCAASVNAGEPVRVSVFSLFRPQRLVVKPARAAVLRVDLDGRFYFVEGAQSVSFRREGSSLDCFFLRELRTARRAHIAARDGGVTEFALVVPGRIERRFRGTLEVAARAGALEAIVALDLETAVASVVEAESPAGAQLEARKAQAVVSRSYYLAARGRHVGYDFCDTTHCQFLREPAADESPAAQTAGLVLVHGSAIVGALYSAACGGRTKSAADAGLPENGYPFFSVECETCRRSAGEWVVRFSGSDAELIRAKPHSEPVRLDIVRRLGWKALPSNNYEMEPHGAALTLRGRGSGHGLGLCQQGAAAMAAAGADFRAILNRYFPATAIRDGTVR